MRVQSRGQENLLEKGMATHPVSLLENFMDRGAWRATVHGVPGSDTAEWLTFNLLLNSREKRINELENRTVEITQSEVQRKNRPKKKNEKSLKNLWDYNKRSNIQTIRVSGEEKVGGAEKYSKK